MKQRVFISSVQSEFAAERRMLKDYIEHNPVLRRFFEVFVFESDVPPVDKRTDEVYLDALAHCQIYVALVGARYCGGQPADPSPTEREYDEATRLGLKRIVLVDAATTARREPRETAFLDKISNDLTWHAYDNSGDLLNWVLAALDTILDAAGVYRTRPFDRAPCEDATLEDIDETRVSWFVRQARALRGLKLAENASVSDVFTHFKLFSDEKGTISNAAILLFGKDPQSFLLSSEIKCVHWPTAERHKPILAYQIYRGTLFELIDMAVEFVLARIDLSVGTRDNGPQVSRDWEIPKSVIAEAIANAVAHRDYASTGSVQVELFPDRLLVMNPGTINPALKKDMLFKEHASYPNNPRIADPLFYTKHIERLGTGLTDLIEACRAAGLADPLVEPEGGTYAITIFRRKKSSSMEDEPLNELLNEPLNPSFDNELTQAIFDTILANPGIKQKDLAKILSVSSASIKRHVELLKDYVEYRGSKKSGGYHSPTPTRNSN